MIGLRVSNHLLLNPQWLLEANITISENIEPASQHVLLPTRLILLGDENRDSEHPIPVVRASTTGRRVRPASPDISRENV